MMTIAAESRKQSMLPAVALANATQRRLPQEHQAHHSCQGGRDSVGEQHELAEDAVIDDIPDDVRAEEPARGCGPGGHSSWQGPIRPSAQTLDDTECILQCEASFPCMCGPVPHRRQAATAMALDEATTALLGQLAESGAKPISQMTPEEARGFGVMLKQMYGPGPDMARAEDTTIPAGGGDVPLRILVPKTEPNAVIVYYHGGGWVIGALDEFDTLGRQLAERTSATVVLVDYRLAPEHRYPTAAEDAWAALQWINDNKADLAGVDVPLIVMGDSAGGNLSAVVAQRAKIGGGPDLALQVLLYPVTDSDVDNETYTDPANQLMLNRDAMIWFWDHYAPDAADRQNVDASPSQADDLSGLPPALVLTAEHDVLRQEGEAYADKHEAAGVPVERHRVPGQMHGFFTMVNVLPGAATGMDLAVDAIDKTLSATTA